MEKETSEAMIKMKVRTFIGLIFGLITVTNSFTVIYNKIHENERQIAYNKERSDRIAERKKAEAITRYEFEILRQELEFCKNELNQSTTVRMD